MVENTVVLAIRAFNAAFARRVRAARERLSKRLGRQVTQREMAETLANAAGRTVSTGAYRGYENSREPVLMPLGLLYHFAVLTGTTLEELLAPVAHAGFAGHSVSEDDVLEYESGVPIPHYLLFGFCETLGMPLEELLAPPIDPRDAAMAAGDVRH